MIELFELAQRSRNSLPRPEDCDLCPESNRLTGLPSVADLPKFIRFSSESFPDLEGPELDALSNLCAHPSQDFFVSNASNLWVRTCIRSTTCAEKLFSPTFIGKECCKVMSIHSNVLPCDSYWTTLRAMRDGASKRVHFPSSILRQVHGEQRTLMQRFEDWRKLGEECDIGQYELHSFGDGNIEKLFWKIQPSDVVLDRFIATGADGETWQVKWKGGTFVRKVRRGFWSSPQTEDRELKVLETLSHPHIVYGFGESIGPDPNPDEIPGGKPRAVLYMEEMQTNLFRFVVESWLSKLYRAFGTRPFSRGNSLDVMLQIANAMAYMHSTKVVHGDLKPHNILMSKIEISGNIHYFLVKVADFGDAHFINNDEDDFKPSGFGTKAYAAPELLKYKFDWRVKPNSSFCFPTKIDVYSFGCVAYEVLTGYPVHDGKNLSAKSDQKLVITGCLNPSHSDQWTTLISENRYPDELIKLVESCWKLEPRERPSFSYICEELEECKLKLLNLYSIVVPNVEDESKGPSHVRTRGASQIRRPFTREDSLDVMLQIATYMHSTGVVHGDLKSHYIIMSDFEILGNIRYFLVKVVHSGDAHWQIISKNEDDRYAAPELLNLRKDQASEIYMSSEMDVYSFGCVAYEVLTGHAVHDDRYLSRENRNLVIAGNLKPSDSEGWKTLINEGRYPLELIELVESCWELKPENRPSFSQICEELKDCKLELEKRVLWMLRLCIVIGVLLFLGAWFVLESPRLSSTAIFVTSIFCAVMIYKMLVGNGLCNSIRTVTYC